MCSERGIRGGRSAYWLRKQVVQQRVLQSHRIVGAFFFSQNYIQLAISFGTQTDHIYAPYVAHLLKNKVYELDLIHTSRCWRKTNGLKCITPQKRVVLSQKYDAEGFQSCQMQKVERLEVETDLQVCH